MLSLSRRLLPLTAALLATAACEPLACQGRVEGQNPFVEDVPELPPKCDGNSTQFVGDADITNQAQLNTLLNCNTVQGSIIIHDSDDIVDVGALSTLTSINSGYFLAFNNSALENIQLPVLQSLDTGFAAIDNPLLTAVNLPEVITFKGDLTMRNNPAQTQIAIPKVEVLDNSDIIIEGEVKVVSFGNIILGDLPALTSLDGGFEALEEIRGSLEVWNTGLVNFNGLERLTNIDNTGGAAQPRSFIRVDKLNPGLAIGIDFDDEFNVVPAGNPNLENFAGLEALDVVVGDVFVGFNASLQDFTGLDDIKAINGNFTVVENDELTNFIGFNGDDDNDNDDDGLSAINGGLFVGLYFDRFGKGIAGGNDSLVDLDGLQSLTTVTGDFVLGFNTAMEDLNGLTLFTTLGGDLTFLGQNMDSLKGAVALTTIGGDLNFGQLLRQDGQPFDPNEVDDTLKLTDVFNKATVVSTEVKIDFQGGQNGFDSLTNVNGNLIVAFSDLTDLQFSDPDGDGAIAAANLTTVNGSLILYGNSAPDSLDGINTVNSLGGLVVNFAIDGFGDLQPFENNGFNDMSDLDVDLGAGGLKIGFDNDLNAAAFDTLRAFGTIAGDVILASVDENENDRGPTDLSGFDVTNIGGDFVVCAIKNGDDAPIPADLDNLTALNLNNTNNVGGDVIVAFCSELTNTAMTVGNVGGSFELTGLPAVEAINGLGNLSAAGEVLLHDLPDVTDIVLPALATITGNMEIVNNPQVDTLDFGNGMRVGATLRVVDLPQLLSLDGFSGLQRVGGGVGGAIVDQDGDFDIIDCPALEDTNGLNALEFVGGNLTMRRLDNIKNAAEDGGENDLSFNALTEVGGLQVTQMENLEDLAGLETLSVVQGTLLLSANDKLETLFGLQGLTSIGRKLSIVDNPVLATPFFDDDDQDREVDVDDDDGNNNEPEDPDATFESGLLSTFDELGDAIRDESGVILGGQTGVLELRNNPNLDEEEFLDVVINEAIETYEGLIITCGNDGTVDLVDEEQRLVSFADCAQAQDGVIDVFNGGGGGDVDAGEGEGEGE